MHFEERLPGPDGPRARMINYYQWVTLFILSQAVLFLLPKLIWRTVFTEGFYVSSIAQRLKDTIAKSVELERRKKLILDLVHYVDRSVLSSVEPGLVSIYIYRCCVVTEQISGCIK